MSNRIVDQKQILATITPTVGHLIRRADINPSPAPEAPLIVQEVLHSPGQIIDPSTRAFFELRLGHDFSQVRVHTDDKASKSARALNSKAFTAGQEVVFGPGQYAPETQEGKELLEHELIHVVEQNANDYVAENSENHAIKQQKHMPAIKVGATPIQAKPDRRHASKLIPDLDDSTVTELSSLIRYGFSKKIRQSLIDTIISDRQGKGDNFTIMENDKPIYVDAYPSSIPKENSQRNGITLPAGQKPDCFGKKPCVFIGPTAFEGSDVEERLVRLYSTIMHEYQHANQWQKPKDAIRLSKPGREVEAFFWEIENSQGTGLAGQHGPFSNVWDEAKRYWKLFQISSEWRNLSAEEKERYKKRFEKMSNIAKRVLDTK